MKRRLNLIALAAIAILAYTTGMAFANHADYIAKDTERQTLQPGRAIYPETFAHEGWALREEDTPITWRADAAIRPLVVKVLAQWTSTIPELEWREVQANKARNVTFFQADKCGRQDDTAGYFHVDADLGWYADDLRQANYWREATVCVKSQTGANVSARFKEGIIAHEIGHTYGLGEAYIDNRRTSNLCNDSVSSAMDGAMFALVSGQQQLQMCDKVYGPTTRDEGLVDNFYSTGGLTDWVTTSPYVQWKDSAWAESQHDVYFRYRLDSTLTTQREYKRIAWKDRIGSHKLMPPDAGPVGRTPTVFQVEVDLTRHQATVGKFATLPANTAYKVCGAAYYEQYAAYSTATCAPEILVSNADHNTDAALLNRYDTTDDDTIDGTEVLDAVSAYFAGNLTVDQILLIVSVYFDS